MRGHMICHECGIDSEEGRMFDEFICLACRKGACLEQLVRKQMSDPSHFRRYIPQEVRKRVMDEAGGLCQYCFVADADEIDHIIPFSYLPDHSIENLIASCSRCNGLAGAEVFTSLPEKRQFVQGKVLKKINKMNLAIWTVDELAEMDRSLVGGRKIIARNHEEALRIQKRLKDLGISVRY